MTNHPFIALIFLACITWSSVKAPIVRQRPAYAPEQAESKLIINKKLIAYLNRQAAIDAPEAVILFADSIIMTESDTLRNVDLIIYANYFKIDRSSLTLVSADSGQQGKNILIVAGEMAGGSIRLPGNHGGFGEKGKDGIDGDPRNIDPGENISPGTRGEPGLRGQKGGDGGNVTIYSVNKEYPLIFSAPGGKGGQGGPGGQGGLTYKRKILRIINRGRENEQIIYGPIESVRMAKGPVGPTGEKGKAGKMTKHRLNAADFEVMAEKEYINDWREVSDKGWRIVFRNKADMAKQN